MTIEKGDKKKRRARSGARFHFRALLQSSEGLFDEQELGQSKLPRSFFIYKPRPPNHHPVGRMVLGTF